jgi:hypothetical protein
MKTEEYSEETLARPAATVLLLVAGSAAMTAVIAVAEYLSDCGPEWLQTGRHHTPSITLWLGGGLICVAIVTGTIFMIMGVWEDNRKGGEDDDGH